jgi:hypothetical protein
MTMRLCQLFSCTGSVLLSFALLNAPEAQTQAPSPEPETAAAPASAGPSTSAASSIEVEPAASFKPLTWGQAFDKHAPLAFFSAGSLAVGGLIAAIRADRSLPANARGNTAGRDVAWALGLSGAGAVTAGLAFWYYAHAEVTRDLHDTPDGFSFAPTFDGKMGFIAAYAVNF